MQHSRYTGRVPRLLTPHEGRAVSIHTSMDQIVNVAPCPGGVKIVVECSEDVCEPVEIALSADEWDALVNQGNVVIDEAGL